MASHFKRTDGRVVSEDASVRREDDGDGRAPIGRHARRPGAVSGAHGTDASVTGAFQRLDPSVTGSFAALAPSDLRPIDAPSARDDAGAELVDVDDASPRPIGVDPAVTGSFSRITPEMAARAVTRDTADAAASAVRSRRGSSSRRLRHADKPSVPSRQTVVRGRTRTFALIAVAAAAVLVAAVLVTRRALSSFGGATGSDAAATQAEPEESITYAGARYELADGGDGTTVLTAQSEGSSSVVNVAVINGTPARLLAHNGSILVPESYADGTWDIIAYTPGGDALAALVVGGDGEPVHGAGTITDAHLDGDALVISDTTGAVTSVSLVG